MNAQLSQPQSPSKSKVRVGKCLASASVILGLITVVVPVNPATALPVYDVLPFLPDRDFQPSQGDFQRCTGELIKLKITSEEAASACARAFKPTDLERCVSRIGKENGFTGIDALSACRQVRRPVEMASCVVDIRRRAGDSVAADVLDNCRRSLLPERFANCVVGLNQSAKILPALAMNTCNDASDFPRELDPTFLPYSAVPEVAPLQTSPSITAPTTPTAP